MSRAGAKADAPVSAARSAVVPNRRLALFACSAFLAVLLFAGFDLWRAYDDVMDEAQQNAAMLNRILTDHMTRTMRVADATLTKVGETVSAVADDPAAMVRVVERLREISAIVPAIGDLIVVDAKGHRLATPTAAALPDDFSRFDFFAALAAPTAASYVGRPLQDAGSGAWLLPVSRRLSAADGGLVGVAIVLINIEYIERFFSTFDFGPGGIASLLRDDGAVLIRQPTLPPGSAAPTVDMRRMKSRFASEPTGNFRDTSSLDGIDRLLSYSKIPGTPLMFFAGRAVAPALAEWHREIRAELTACVVIGALLFTVAALLSRRQVAADAAVRTAEARVYRMTDNLPGAIYSRVRHPDGRIEYPYISPGIRNILDYNPEEIMADAGLMLGTVYPEDRERFFAAVEHSAAELEPWQLEFRVVKRSGEVKWVYGTSHPRRGASGEIIWDGFLLDISELKRTEAALDAVRQELQEKNRVLDIALNNMGQGLAVYDADKCLLAYNPRYCEMLKLPTGFVRPGLTLTELFDCSVAMGNFTRDEGIRVMAEQLRVTRSSERQTFYLRLADRRIIEGIHQPLSDGGAVTTFIDVTAAKRYEEELAAKSTFLQVTLEHMADGISVFDKNRRLLAWNDRFLALFGLSHDFAYVGASWEDIIRLMIERGGFGTVDPEALLTRLTAERWGSEHAQWERRMPSGTIIDCQRNRMPDGSYVTLYRDITALKQAEEELAAKTTFLQVTLEHMGNGISVFDKDNRLRAWNDRCMSLLDIPPEMVRVGTPWEDFARFQAARGDFGTVDPDKYVAMIRNQRDDAEESRWERRQANGTVIAFQRNRMPDGGYVTLYRDITALTQARDALIAAKEEAEEANRSKGEFLANMSHELRTPLNAIIGFSEILSEQMFGPLGSPRYLEYTRHIHASGTHLLDLINDVLDMSKIEAGKFELNEERVEVPQLLRVCQTMVQARADNGGIALVMNLPTALPPVWADGRALKQVILNLLSNAVKFTPAGGRVTLAATWTKDGVALTVTDSGIGIPPEALARIVRPFGQADASISRRYGGTGLGLPISKRLIELHGGTLEIESALNSGTTVTVALPASRVVADGSRLAATQQ